MGDITQIGHHMAREIEDVKRKDRGRIEDVRLDAHNGAAVKPPAKGGGTLSAACQEKRFLLTESRPPAIMGTVRSRTAAGPLPERRTYEEIKDRDSQQRGRRV